jgi:hypothetical protein
MQFCAIPIREHAEANLFHHAPYAINICVHHWSHAGARHATTTAQDRSAYRIQERSGPDLLVFGLPEIMPVMGLSGARVDCGSPFDNLFCRMKFQRILLTSRM